MKRLLFILDFTLLPKAVINHWSLLKQLIIRNIESRYRGSMLGLLWSFAQPLLMLCVYTFVFSVVFKIRWGMETAGSRSAFAMIMFCGMAMYNVFAESLTANCGIVLANVNFVKKVIFPLEILPLAQTVASFTLGLVWFFLLFIGTIFFFGEVSFTMLLLPVILLDLFLFTLGLSYFLASLGVYVRDMLYALGVVLQILFFMTPIFYSINMVPERYRWLLQINPLTTMVEEARKVFLYGQLPNWTFLAISFVVSIIVCQLGIAWFTKTKKGFSDVL